MQENSLAEQIAAARKTVMEADTVIVGLYGRVRSGAKQRRHSRGTEPQFSAGHSRQKQVIGISFGQSVHSVVVPRDEDLRRRVRRHGSLQRAAARELLDPAAVHRKAADQPLRAYTHASSRA
ncbi:MAG: hypothetical protein IPM21_10565 [Acidobacteria bacterium]|nr:hypothetical protein [Acidobacteriota bacterium]